MYALRRFGRPVPKVPAISTCHLKIKRPSGRHRLSGGAARRNLSRQYCWPLQGHRANHYADTYVLGTVLLATVLFFCGIVPQFPELRTKVFLLSMAVLLLIFDFSKILMLPRAP